MTALCIHYLYCIAAERSDKHQFFCQSAGLFPGNGESDRRNAPFGGWPSVIPAPGSGDSPVCVHAAAERGTSSAASHFLQAPVPSLEQRPPEDHGFSECLSPPPTWGADIPQYSPTPYSVIFLHTHTHTHKQ